MSYFGHWECPACHSTWTGSIGWHMPSEEELPNMLHNMCGCDGRIEGAKTPLLSASVMNFVQSEDRTQKLNRRKGGI